MLRAKPRKEGEISDVRRINNDVIARAGTLRKTVILSSVKRERASDNGILDDGRNNIALMKTESMGSAAAATAHT